MKQAFFSTGMYIVNEEYRIIDMNDRMRSLYPQVQVGDICYRSVALRDTPCEACPLRSDNALFYNPVRREWIHANAAVMDYPGHGRCYNVQFQLRQKSAEAGQEELQDDNMDEHIMELSGGSLDVCAIGGYCEPGSPLSFANENMIRTMGYGSLTQLRTAVDGLVVNTIHPDDVDRVTRDLTRCALHGGTFESTYRMRKADLSWFWVVTRGKRVQTRSGAFVLLAVVSDMTEFVKRQDSLRKENEALLRQELTSQAVLEHMPGGYHRCANAPGWPFLYFGSSFEAVTGWTRQEIETEFDNLFINMVLPEDIPLCAGIIRDIEVNGYSNAIYRLKKKGGGYLWISDSTMRVDLGEESFFQGTLADVTRQIEELEQAKQEAEASNQAKSTFLFNVSHDFRTPMNAIQGFAHIIQDKAEDPQAVREAVHKLQQSSQMLMTLMNDVLDLSRIERGKEAVICRPLNMLDHVQRLHEMIAVEMAESGIHFSMENDIQHPMVLADDLKLSRMAMNLLSNARKFTPAGGSVSFGILESGYDGKRADYSLYVRDTGIGMSPDFQQRAFDQFERERTSTDSGISGSGLGLSIIKRIADLLGGTCVIESALGKGSLITITVPLELAREHQTEAPLPAKAVDFSGKRILLVEDNAFNREIGRYVFENVGFLVEDAENGRQCLETLNQVPEGYFDFILMDIQMPIMDGYTATQKIRRHPNPAIAAIPIIAMTANAFEDDKRKCLEAGMDGHIGKPLESGAVLAEILRVLGT